MKQSLLNSCFMLKNEKTGLAPKMNGLAEYSPVCSALLSTCLSLSLLPLFHSKTQVGWTLQGLLVQSLICHLHNPTNTQTQLLSFCKMTPQGSFPHFTPSVLELKKKPERTFFYLMSNCWAWILLPIAFWFTVATFSFVLGGGGGDLLMGPQGWGWCRYFKQPCSDQHSLNSSKKPEQKLSFWPC